MSQVPALLNKPLYPHLKYLVMRTEKTLVPRYLNLVSESHFVYLDLVSEPQFVDPAPLLSAKVSMITPSLYPPLL